MEYGNYANVQNSIVIGTLVADQNYINNSKYIGDSNNWIATDANTFGNIHYTITVTSNSVIKTPDGGTPFRGNYAYPGYTYDTVNDVFYAPQPYPSWILNTTTWLWEAPISKPTDGLYVWDEPTISWLKITLPAANTA